MPKYPHNGKTWAKITRPLRDAKKKIGERDVVGPVYRLRKARPKHAAKT